MIPLKQKEIAGAFLKNPNLLAEHEINIRDITDPESEAIYNAVFNAWSKKEDTSILAISKLSNIQPSRLIELQDNSFTTHLPFLVKELTEDARKERIRSGLGNIINSDISDSKEMLNDILCLYRKEQLKEKKAPEIKEVVSRFKQVQHNNRKYGILGVNTKLDVFNEVNINLVPGRIFMIGAYTSIGKTALMIEMLSRMYSQDNPSGIVITTEMTEENILSRYIANKTGINSDVVFSGRMLPKHREIADAVRDEWSEKNVKIYDSIKTIEQVENAVRIAEYQGGCDFLFLDFIQNIRKHGCRSKYEESSQVAIDLQNLAKDCKICIVCLSQLTLGQMENDQLAYKGAGELAEAADVGVFMKRSKDDKSRLKIEIKKNRHGPLNEIIMQYKDGWTRLEEVGK